MNLAALATRIPIAFVVACGLALVGELLLRFTRAGLQLRAVGSDGRISTTLTELGSGGGSGSSLGAT